MMLRVVKLHAMVAVVSIENCVAVALVELPVAE